jgi:primosomal protein N' (replication factor Y)
LRTLFEDTKSSEVERASAHCAERLTTALEGTSAVVLGPAPAPIALLRGRHRRHVLVKCPPQGNALALARDVALALAGECGRARMTVDVDPQSLL